MSLVLPVIKAEVDEIDFVRRLPNFFNFQKKLTGICFCFLTCSSEHFECRKFATLLDLEGCRFLQKKAGHLGRKKKQERKLEGANEMKLKFMETPQILLDWFGA